MSNAAEFLMNALRARGLEASLVPIHRLKDLKEEVEGRHRQGMFDEQFYTERLTRFDFAPPADLPEARSIIVLARPSPQTGIVFHWNGQSRTLILPPTYVGYTALPPQIEALVNEILSPLGYCAVQAPRIPLKPLAVRSGLAEYGKNNITYVAGMGSFHHLFALYSDLPCEQDGWREPRMLARCEHCRACIIKCPTEAIREDRFLLHAERCLVFHNEKPGCIPFPAWIDSTWHNSLFGCMLCQRYCPEDKKVKNWVETLAEFSEEETALLLQGISLDRLSAETTRKLELLELTESLDQLPRNLGVLLSREQTTIG